MRISVFSMRKRQFIYVISFFCAAFLHLKAQYFGQNKIGYHSIDFKVMNSSDLKLYYYTSDSTARKFLQEAQIWYRLHQKLLKDTIHRKNPIILYNNHADFQQTTVFDSNITPGTGGVTEASRKRVVLPFTQFNRATSQVLGHELVHAFQYNLILENDSLTTANLGNVPLWATEGLAEFLSIGRLDSHTASWMRDAVAENYFPTIEALFDPRFFPYRYGQAFWAFVTGLWGEEIIRELYLNMAIYGVEDALLFTLGQSSRELSKLWKETTENYYQPFLQNKQKTVGELFYASESSPYSISPSASPDGQFVAFYTQRDPISEIELFVVDVSNKKVAKKINSINRVSHIDFISILESSPTWSPDSKQVALVVFSKGKNKLAIVEAVSGKVVENIELPGVNSFMYPSWSPTGKHIAVSGMRDGQSDIYLLNLETRTVEQLTFDAYSDIQPSWSSNGSKIVFSTDRLSYMYDRREGFFNLAILDVETRKIQNLDLFPGADNMNALFTKYGNILFLSDRDGCRNLYKHDLSVNKTYLMTNFLTGISGITRYSQAVSVSSANSLVYYSLYQKEKYKVFSAELKDFSYTLVDHTTINPSAGYLPPKIPIKKEEVTKNIAGFASNRKRFRDSLQLAEYTPQFRLDYVSSTGIGVSTVSGFGTGLNGGVLFLFRDIVANNNLSVVASVNGEIYDIGIGALFLNKKGRLDWGFLGSHTPYLTVFRSVSEEVEIIEGQEVPLRQVNTDVYRTFIESFNFLTYFPFSRYRRIEAQGGVTYYSYRIDRLSDQFFNEGGAYRFLRRVRKKLDAPSPIALAEVGAAFVEDRSNFGTVGPIDGNRYRIGGTQLAGQLNYSTVTVDMRWYKWIRPLGLAFRLYHFGRYGKDGEDTQLAPLNVAFPTLVRGYDFVNVYRDIGNSVLLQQNSSAQFVVNDYLGSRMLVGNAELRIPLTGIRKFSLLNSNFLHTEMALFADWGLAFASNAYNRQIFGIAQDYEQRPIYSAGVSLRVNLLGFYVLEPFYAIPFKERLDGRRSLLGLNLSPSW